MSSVKLMHQHAARDLLCTYLPTYAYSYVSLCVRTYTLCMSNKRKRYEDEQKGIFLHFIFSYVFERGTRNNSIFITLYNWAYWVPSKRLCTMRRENICFISTDVCREVDVYIFCLQMYVSVNKFVNIIIYKGRSGLTLRDFHFTQIDY